jgi:hypothetical protein
VTLSQGRTFSAPFSLCRFDSDSFAASHRFGTRTSRSAEKATLLSKKQVLVIQTVTNEFPTQGNRELIRWIRELFSREQGKISLKAGSAETR